MIFSTTEPFLVQTEIKNLLLWTNENLKSEELHPLIIVATFVYEFLSIHPYQDGNGRLSRLLTTLLLLRQGYDFMQYASMEIEIEKRKKEYYKALMDGQKGRGTEKEIISAWVIFFLETLEATILKLEDRYAKIKNKGSYLNDRQKEVLAFVRENEPVKINDITSTLARYTQYTLKKDILYLRNEGLIKKLGKARGTIYMVAEKTKER